MLNERYAQSKFYQAKRIFTCYQQERMIVSCFRRRDIKELFALGSVNIGEYSPYVHWAWAKNISIISELNKEDSRIVD